MAGWSTSVVWRLLVSAGLSWASYAQNAAELSDKGVVLRQQGDLLGALETFRAALSLEPDNARLYSNLALTLRAMGQVEQALADRRIPGCDILLADLGVCSLHFDAPDRGFSLKADGPLDMRLNPHEPEAPTAAELVNTASENELTKIFREYGEERWARPIARAIVRERARAPIRSTAQLREIVARAIPRKAWPPKVDPATRVFQALRIAVNRELEELDALLAKLPEILRVGGRAGIISFHSLEDRRVKEAFRELARECTCPPEWPQCRCERRPKFRVLTRKPVTASEAEVEQNPRARSAKLRVIERIAKV